MAKKPETNVERVPIDDLLPDPENARTHSPRNLALIRDSLRDTGAGRSLVLDEDNVTLAGNATLASAKEIGMTHVRIVDAEGDELVAVRRKNLTPLQKRRLALFDNRAAELAEWDPEQLQAFDDETLAGLWSADEFECLLHPEGLTATEDDFDGEAAAEAVTTPITKAGDLWILGEHRLLCGDSTKAEDVARLMGAERAGLMNTDPPYGVGYDNSDRPNPGVAKPRVANDTLVDAKLQNFLESAFRVAVDHALRPNAAWYLWHAHLTQGFFAAAAAAANVVLHRQIIWVKPVLLLTRGQYHWKHEPCFFGWVKGHQPPDYGAGSGERNQTTVWEFGSVTHADRSEFNHSTPKPVGIFSLPIVKHLKSDEVCFEPFAGSGPQFVAAEQTGRRCFGIEIEPKYCDVIVARWEKLTGKKAERLK